MDIEMVSVTPYEEPPERGGHGEIIRRKFLQYCRAATVGFSPEPAGFFRDVYDVTPLAYHWKLLDNRHDDDDPLREFVDRIETSRAELERLPADADDEGPTFSPDAWTRAVRFLRAAAEVCFDAFGRMPPLPLISSGPDESVDIHWKLEGIELLINVPASLTKLAGFYGDNRLGCTIKGKLNPSAPNRWILDWLIENV